MKKKVVFAFLLILLPASAVIFALAKTPALHIKDPSPSKLSPSSAVFAAHAKDGRKKWKRLLRARAVREFVNSPGGQALRKNYILPFFDSFFPKASAKHISGHFAKLLGRDVILSKYETDKGDAWLFVARINTQQKIGFYFMRRYLIKRNKLNAMMVENIPAYEIKGSSPKTLYHAVVGNYVIFATQKILMEQSLSLAAGKSNDSFYALPALCRTGFETCFETMGSATDLSSLYSIFILPPDSPSENYHQVIHFLPDTNEEKLRVRLKMFNTAKSKSSEHAPDLKKASLLLPKDTVFFANVDFSAPFRHGESLETFLERKETRNFAKEYLNLNVIKELLPLLDGNAVLASTKIHTLSDETPMPDLFLFLPLKTGSNPAAMKKSALAVTDKIFSKGMKEAYKKKENTVYGTRIVSYMRKKERENAMLTPSYAVIGDFLVATLSRQDMEKILAVRKGYLPCFQDASEYSQLNLPEDAGLYVFSTGEKASEYLKDYFRRIVPVSSGFLEREINEAFIPLMKDLNHFSVMTATMTHKETMAEGSIEFAFKK